MKKVQKNDSVKLHYTCLTDDGITFSSIETGKPIEFKVGEGKLLKAVENGVLGMKVMDSKIINIPFEEAYGPVDKNLIQEIDKSNLTEGLIPEIGMELISRDQNGEELSMRIIKIMENSIIVDANHPLAGKNLEFTIQLLEIL